MVFVGKDIHILDQAFDRPSQDFQANLDRRHSLLKIRQPILHDKKRRINPIRSCDQAVRYRDQAICRCDQPVRCCGQFICCCDQPVCRCDQPVRCCGQFICCCDQPVCRCDQPVRCCGQFICCCDQ